MSQHQPPISDGRISTGIPGLDEVLRGGLPLREFAGVLTGEPRNIGERGALLSRKGDVNLERPAH